VSSKGDVDTVKEQARKAGAAIVKPAHDTFGAGMPDTSRISTDISGEVVWNPAWEQNR
jgi:hypothetical protein